MLDNVIISDRNASSKWAVFHKSPDGLKYLNKDKTSATSWKHENQQEEWEHKSIKCAEALVPGKIDVRYILKALVYNDKVKNQLLANNFPLTTEVNNQIFF